MRREVSDFHSREWKKKRGHGTFIYQERELHAAFRHKNHSSWAFLKSLLLCPFHYSDCFSVVFFYSIFMWASHSTFPPPVKAAGYQHVFKTRSLFPMGSQFTWLDYISPYFSKSYMTLAQLITETFPSECITGSKAHDPRQVNQSSLKLWIFYFCPWSCY